MVIGEDDLISMYDISRECHGLPWGFQDTPCPSPSKPIPIDKVMGFYRYGSRVGYNPWVSKPVWYQNTGSH